MSDYTPSGDPLIGSRGVSSLIRAEFNAIAAAIATKQNINALTSTSISSVAIPGSVPTTVNMVWETGKLFLPGYYVLISDSSNPATNNMFGMILSYNSTSGVASINVTAKTGSGTIAAWTIVTTSQSGVTLGSNTFTGFQNFARASVASSAATSDIWNALGNQIDWTGTATTTGFPAAPQGGVWRELICAGACSFTAGANMLIAGVSSGSTVTCAANDIILVRALTTTQFHLTRYRYDGLQQKNVGSHLSANVYQANGRGSSSTNVRLFTTTGENTLNATITHSATAGTSIVVPVSGRYVMQARDYWTGATPTSTHFGISRNATSGISTLGNLAALAVARPSASSQLLCISAKRYLDAGDTIRLLNVNGATNYDGTDDTQLTVTLDGYA